MTSARYHEGVGLARRDGAASGPSNDVHAARDVVLGRDVVGDVVVHDEPHESIQQRQVDLLVDLRRVTIAEPPRLTRRRSRGRVDGVEGSTTRADAIDANLKFFDAESAP